ncbi:uncharacterized protein [Misgurnus anguillicaudatus]|uniref:uncharacterized protein n=1 Tax=Misgurnus anguillicaudatus TaxID=75329 RepID=UPI003CCF1C46
MIRTESQGMNERVEMMVDIYESAASLRDHDLTDTNTQQPSQHTGSERVRMRCYRSVTVCLVLLCVLLLTAVIVLCVLINTNQPNITKERNQLLTKYTNITEERNQLLTKYTNITIERDQLLKQNENIVKLIVFTDGWFYYNFSLYYISSEQKNWTESRRDCIERGADLIIINNKEEQNIFKISGREIIWIGLSDNEVEGRWKWVDNSTLNTSFWAPGDPRNHTGNEDCVQSNSSVWVTYTCDARFKWICEKTSLLPVSFCMDASTGSGPDFK